MSDLEARVHWLEEEVAALRLALTKVSPSGPGGVVRASILEIVDGQGRTQGSFTSGEHGAHILIHDAQSTPRLALGMGKSGPLLDLLGPDRHSRLTLVLGEDGLPRIMLSDATSTPRMVLQVDVDTQSLRLSDADGQTRFILMVGPDGMPSLSLTSAEGKVRVMLGVDEDYSGLRVYDSHEQGRLVATVDADERPMIAMHDSQQVPRLKITQMPDESAALSLCDPSGRLRLTLTTHKGEPNIILSNSTGQSRVILSGGKTPLLIILDEHGHPIATFPEIEKPDEDSEE